MISNAVINPSKYGDITLNDVPSSTDSLNTGKKIKYEDKENSNQATPLKSNPMRKLSEPSNSSSIVEEIVNNNGSQTLTIDKEKVVTEFSKRYDKILQKYSVTKSTEPVKQSYQNVTFNDNKAISQKGSIIGGQNASGKALFNKYQHVINKYINKENIGDSDNNTIRLKNSREFNNKYEELFMIKDSDDHKVRIYLLKKKYQYYK